MITTQGLKGVLEEQYPFSVEGVTAVNRNLYRVQTEDGYKRLAKVAERPSKLIFAYSAVNTLRDRGFDQVLRIYLTTEGQPFFHEFGNYWVLMDWVQGRTPIMQNLDDLEQTTRDLGRLHRYMNGILPIAGGMSEREWQKWPEKMMEGRKVLESYVKRIKRNLERSQFDHTLLQEYNGLQIRVEQSLKLALSLSCQQMMQNERNERAVAYHRIREKEILLGFDGRIYFINPLNVQYDLRVKDLGDWLKRLIKNYPEEPELLVKVIQWYEDERPLSRGERVWLLSYLLYPSRLIKVVERYQLRKRHWSEDGYLRRLEQCLDRVSQNFEAYEYLTVYFQVLGDV